VIFIGGLMMERKMVLTAVVLLGLLCAAVAQAELYVSTAFGSGADAYVGNSSDEKSTSNYGTSGKLRARTLTTAATDAGNRFKCTFLRFDISQETGDFTGTTLSLAATLLKGGAKVLNVYGLVDETLDNWIESGTGGITYANAPGMLTPTTGGVAGTGGNDIGQYAIDSTKLLLLGTITAPALPSPVTYPIVFTSDPALLNLGSFLNADTNNLVTLVLIAQGNSEDEFASRNNTTAGILFPTLITPEPATMLILGLGSLMVVRRKRS
jgi:hypothetical protein